MRFHRTIRVTAPYRGPGGKPTSKLTEVKPVIRSVREPYGAVLDKPHHSLKAKCIIYLFLCGCPSRIDGRGLRVNLTLFGGQLRYRLNPATYP